MLLKWEYFKINVKRKCAQVWFTKEIKDYLFKLFYIYNNKQIKVKYMQKYAISFTRNFQLHFVASYNWENIFKISYWNVWLTCGYPVNSDARIKIICVIINISTRVCKKYYHIILKHVANILKFLLYDLIHLLIMLHIRIYKVLF